jgi:phage anti-repressor protein
MTNNKLSKAELVKLFTKIPNAFVDDFFLIMKDGKNKITEDFPISLDLVCKWLKCKKDAIRTTLKYSYKKDIDYIVLLSKPSERRGSGGRNKLNIKLTIDCFKRVCMRSKAEMAELVRTYFIELDEFITHYSDQISDGIMRDINKVAAKMKRNPTRDGPGYIYAFYVAKNLIKIGNTENIIERFRTYNTGRLEDVKPAYVFRTESRKQVEGCIKGLLEAKRYKKRREIYEVDLDVIQKLINGCDKMSLQLLEKNTDPAKSTGKFHLVFMKNSGGYKLNV